MQGNLNDLLHLGDLALPEDTALFRDHVLQDVVVDRIGQCFLADEDSIVLTQLPSGEVQEWCLSRIAHYRNHNRLLREQYGTAARSEISKNKSHIRAIRSAYNDAAPIHRHLPPEVLTEIFSHVHPATLMPRPRVPVLGVCRYWRQLLFHTPQFWANLLSLPSWKSWNTKYHDDVSRFRAAMALSAPQTLTITVPYCFTFIADILESHAARLSSLQVGRTLWDVASVAQVLEQDMPLLTHLAILHQWCYSDMTTLTMNFCSYPKLRTLELEGAHFYTPRTPYTSLCHLKLKHCTIQPPSGNTVQSVCAVHNALKLFPNLETLSLSEDDSGGHFHPLPQLTETVYLPCLRYLELEDIPAYILMFLSHLIFPSTSPLVLDPACTLDDSRQPLDFPLFPGSSPSPSDSSTPNTTEFNLCLYRRRSCDMACWEKHGVPSVRVTVQTSTYHRRNDPIALVASLTRQLVAALLPAPAPTPSLPPGVTSLTVHPFIFLGDWEQLLRELAALRRLDYTSCAGTAATCLFHALGKRSELPGKGPGFLCTRLTELVLGWNIPYGTELGEDGLGGEWDGPLQDDDNSERVEEREPPSRISALLLKSLCDTVGGCLAARAEDCEQIRKVSFSVPRDYYYPNRDHAVLEEWQGAWVQQRLRRALGHLVPDIVVTVEVTR